MDSSSLDLTEKNKPVLKQIRCAIYTRKSTSAGLDQDFTTLDSQRESGENYIRSQQSQGWLLLSEKYDDGGFTGSSTDRPALKRLLQDIRDKKIDCVVVYKVDRLSRSLLDFVNLLKLFEENNITFVSVTQHFNTNSSMGRLTLNILLSFAQFEREIISERTKDKMRGSRMKGMFSGGRSPLGYDHSPATKSLIPNPKEAELIRKIFELYCEKKSLLDVSHALTEMGEKTKAYKNRSGKDGGLNFKNTNIQYMLNNVIYIGKVKYEGKIYKGLHEAIISEELFNKAQAIRQQNYRVRGSSKNRKFPGLLTGLLRCTSCDTSISHGYAIKNKIYKYRYYICLNAVKRGRHNCPIKSISAQPIEDQCLETLQQISRDARLESDYWKTLVFEDQMAVVQSLVREVEYDGDKGKLVIWLTDSPEKHERDLPLIMLKKKLPRFAEMKFKTEPLIRKQLLLAHQIRRMLEEGKAKDLGQIAEWMNLSKSRLDQITGLLYLCPKIQENIICGDNALLEKLSEYNLRAICQETDWNLQTAAWTALFPANN